MKNRNREIACGMRRRAARRKRSLQALGAAALLLPGMLTNAAQAAEVEETELRYTHYDEGGQLSWVGVEGLIPRRDPITVDGVAASVKLALADRWKLAFGLLQETWSGATAIITVPRSYVAVETRMTAASAWPSSNGTNDQRLINITTTASPETRRQGNFTLTHEGEGFSYDIGGSLSNERDYKSRSLTAAGRWDFDQRRTTLSASVTHGLSSIDALLPVAMMMGYAEYAWGGGLPNSAYRMYYPGTGNDGVAYVDASGRPHFGGQRRDTSTSVGITRVLSASTLLAGSLSWSHAGGFLNDPYKLVFIGATEIPENRPNQRNQWTVSGHIAHYLYNPGAALHLDYRASHDDWGITAHALEGSLGWAVGRGWSLTPSVRYYSQTAANFYRPWFPVDDYTQYPAASHWSGDQRLGGYGALTAELTIDRRFTNGLVLELSVEHTLRGGYLKLGGGGLDDFANSSSTQYSLALRTDPHSLGGLASGAGMSAGHAMHGPGSHAGHAAMPAGLMYTHLMPKGSWMVDYHLTDQESSGGLRHGGQIAADAEVLADCTTPAPGTGIPGCIYLPSSMSMRMHMLDIMYAPTARLTLMLMPQLMQMDMRMRDVTAEGGSFEGLSNGMNMPMDMHRMDSGGLGDTTLAALYRLWQRGASELHAGLGLSLPTGATDLRMSDIHSVYQTMFAYLTGDLRDYSMQLGSGTWDLIPSITWTGAADRFGYGAQAVGTLRTGAPNASGYRLGNQLQASLWASYRMLPQLSGTLRVTHSRIGAINGYLRGVNPGRYSQLWDFDNNIIMPANSGATNGHTRYSPLDMPGNYGGRFNDVALGLNLDVGQRGSQLRLEWSRPVADDVNGYQLDRGDTVNLAWRMGLDASAGAMRHDMVMDDDADSAGEAPAMPLGAAPLDRSAAEWFADSAAALTRSLSGLQDRSDGPAAWSASSADSAGRPALPAVSEWEPSRADAGTESSWIAGLAPIRAGSADHRYQDPFVPAFVNSGAHGQLSLGGSSNGSGIEGGAALMQSGDRLVLAYAARFVHAGDYQDGSGASVSATSVSRREQTLAAATLLGGGVLSAGVGWLGTPGQGAPNQLLDRTGGANWSATLGYALPLSWGAFRAVAFHDVAREDWGLLTDKQALDWNLPTRDRRGSSSGYRVEWEVAAAPDQSLRIGQEYRRLAQDDRLGPVAGSDLYGPDANTILNGAREQHIALYADWSGVLDANWTGSAGVRFEQVLANTGLVHWYFPFSIDEKAYDAAVLNNLDRHRGENHWDGRFALRYAPVDTWSLEAGVARTVRSPTLIQRYAWVTEFATTGTLTGGYGDGNAYLGDIDLEPEATHTIRAVLDWHDPDAHAWSLRIAPFASLVANFIGIDPNAVQVYAESQPNPGRSAQRWFNHDARIYGGELAASRSLDTATGRWTLAGSISASRGEDLTSGSRLAGLVPLRATLRLEHSAGGWRGWVDWRRTAAMPQIDTSLGAVPTTALQVLVPASDVLDIAGHYAWRAFELEAGIDNLFDRRYGLATQGVDLVRYNFDPAHLGPVNGPGRSAHLALRWNF